MCGIAGLVSYKEGATHSTLQAMLSGISHRGPDGVGYFIHDRIGVLHARLSIIDTSELGSQPLFNEDRTLAVVCNGEIYNYQVLRKELEKKGHNFLSQSDTEVIVHLYEEHRHELPVMLGKLKGMFAFAIIDCKSNELLLVRDRFGIKPLYYTRTNQGFYFASELSSLVAIRPDLKKSLDYTSIYEFYQFLSIPEPNTVYENAKTLPAGTYAIINQKSISILSWYDLAGVVKSQLYYNRNVFFDSLCKKIEESVKEHMVADVPVGSFLSAGIDSTMVTHFASRNNHKSFAVVSVGFPNNAEDESQIAGLTAKKMGITNFYPYYLSGGFFNDVPQIIRSFDQPFAAFSAFSLFRISKLAKQHVKVVLSGDGGDEVFGGYNRHRFIKLPWYVGLTPPMLRTSLSRLFNDIGGERLMAVSRQYNLSFMKYRFLKGTRLIDENTAFSLIPEGVRKKVDRNRFERNLDEVFHRARELPWLQQLLYADISTFLKSEMLYKVDRMTMANQLEGRVPLLDHEVVEMSFSASPELLRSTESGKLPLRSWVEKYYPGLGNRPKSGFNTPIIQALEIDQQENRVVDKLINQGIATGEVESISVQRVKEKYASGHKRSSTALVSIACLGGWLTRL
jgi:asparagine synthase (glutamine-hydrolysing)